MKKLLLSVAAVFAFIFALTGPSCEAYAQNVASIKYDFSSIPIPSGAQAVYDLDQNAMTGLLQKNADGSFAVDQAGNFYADSAAVSSFVSGLAALYELPGYTVMNQEMEKQYLITAIAAGMSGTRVPMVTVSTVPGAKESAESQIVAESEKKTEDQTQPQIQAAASGMTYVDIDIANQKLVYYVNGQPTLISDIVTGNVSRHHDTPTGTYQVYGKSRNRTLKGPNYESFVRYWMPFTGNYGMHDASWRSSFGGSIYQTNGSHGCVNMPRETAEALYNTISVGTTVIIH
ncbi:MAG: L,D-transpeptidase [Lachnospiraceae bacterium]|nr:L,D-transpeptidase [Lachnospiraceae bacterium]